MGTLEKLQNSMERTDGRLLMAILLMVTIMGVQLVASMLFSLSLGTFYDAPSMPLVAALAALTSYLVVLTLVSQNLSADEGVSLADIGLRGGRFSWPATFGVAILIYLTMSLIAGLYVQATGYVNEQEITGLVGEGFSGGPLVVGLMLLAVVVLGPVVEEIIFRGYLQSALAEKMPPWLAVGISSVVFAAFHLELGAFPLLAIVGVGLGAAYQITGTLWPAVLIHMVNNALAVVQILPGD